MNSTEALQLLAIDAQAATAPTLDDAELGVALSRARRPDKVGNPPANVASAPVWAASTAYYAGEVVRAADRWWVCETPGTSGATAPQWPVATGMPVGGPTEAEIIDGTVVWEDNGGAWRETYDSAAAAAEAWAMKAAKAATLYDFQVDGQQFARSQMRAACLEQANAWRAKSSTGAGSVRTPSC